MARSHVYIVGAGFSKHAGLPLQKDFTEALLEPRADESHPMRPLVEHLGTFVHDAFGHSEEAKAKFWPNLEDVFTNIDLAANTGHHLGHTHAPVDLRMTRRVLLARMMRMLDERYALAEKAKDSDWKRLDHFFQNLDTAHSAFISINWDTVVERKLATSPKVHSVDYRCGAVPATFPRTGKVIAERKTPDGVTTVPVVKIHGSVNWLYCDNCRQLYWFPAKDGLSVAMQLLTPREAKRLELSDVSECAKWRCMNCTDVPLTTRIATFSYLKALDFPMFERSWLSAERILRQAKKWIFVGYSLPAADYEFKHLLKRVQLSMNPSPEFVVITGGPKSVTDSVYRNYQGFFGRGIKRQENFFRKGMTAEAVAAAQKSSETSK
jgi:NAD-dependent SIR2 family protein deacetylase